MTKLVHLIMCLTCSFMMLFFMYKANFANELYIHHHLVAVLWLMVATKFMKE